MPNEPSVLCSYIFKQVYTLLLLIKNHQSIQQTVLLIRLIIYNCLALSKCEWRQANTCLSICLTCNQPHHFLKAYTRKLCVLEWSEFSTQYQSIHRLYTIKYEYGFLLAN